MGLLNATSNYGQGFIPTKNPDEFYIKIYTGGFAGSRTAEKGAVKEIEKFLAGNKVYTKYKILGKKFNWIPSYFKFIILFEK